MADDVPNLRGLTNAQVRMLLEDVAMRAERKAAAIERTCATMVKPAEKPTRRELESKARNYSNVVWRCRDASRALSSAPIEPTDA